MVEAVSPRQAMDWLASGQAVLIDVREPGEFSAAHIPYALSAPLARTTEILRGMDLPADRKIIFQCQKGARGGQACAAVGPTCRIESATKTRHSGRCLACSMAASMEIAFLRGTEGFLAVGLV